MTIPTNIVKDAFIEGDYRYWLTRKWAEGKRLVSIMANPSDADAFIDDPTLLRNIHFANAWGFGSLEVVNPHAFRSPSPKVLKVAKEPVGPKNDAAIESALYRGDMFLVAWGNPPSNKLYRRIIEVQFKILEMARKRQVPVVCLGRTMYGHPKHPLARGIHRVPDSQQPIQFSL